MTSPETLTNILSDHEKFVTNVRGIPITGITEEQMNSSFRSTKKTLRAEIQSIEGVRSIESMRDTSMGRKWIVITNRENETIVKKRLAYLFKNESPTETTFPTVVVGNRFSQENTASDRDISSYAAVLQSKFMPTNEKKGEEKPKLSKMQQYVYSREKLQSTTKTKEKSTNIPTTDRQRTQLELAILNRVTSIENKWRTMEQKNTQTQKELNESENKKLAEITKQEMIAKSEEMEHKLAEKIEEMHKEQQEKVQEIEQRLVKRIDSKLDSKADRISVEVANYVVEKLMAVLSPHHNHIRKEELMTHPKITQEGIKSQQSPTTAATKSTTNELQKKLVSNDITPMISELEETTIQQGLNPNHDKLNGTEETTR